MVFLHPLMARAKAGGSYHVSVAKEITTFSVLKKPSLIPLLAVSPGIL